MPNRPSRDTMDIHEVAELCRCSVSSVRRWMREVDGFPAPTRPAGGRLVWFRQQIMEWLKSQRVTRE